MLIILFWRLLLLIGRLALWRPLDNLINFFPAINLSQFLVIQTLDPNQYSAKILDPDPQQWTFYRRTCSSGTFGWKTLCRSALIRLVGYYYTCAEGWQAWARNWGLWTSSLLRPALSRPSSPPPPLPLWRVPSAAGSSLAGLLNRAHQRSW